MAQIKLDVARTFRVFNLKFLNSEVEMGENKLYNLLKVYAMVIEPEIGYTQGMNFIAAIILMNCPNEALACFMFMKVLNKDYWVRMFISSTPKLFDMSQKIMDQIEKRDPALFQHLFEYQIYLEIVLAGPLLTFFSSNLGFSESTHILTNYMLDGEKFILELIVNVFTNMRENILALKDQFEIQQYLSKQIYDDALSAKKFYIEQKQP